MRFLRAAVRRGEASDVESLWISRRDRPARPAGTDRAAAAARRRARRRARPRAPARARRHSRRAPSIPGTSVAATGAPADVGAGPDRPRRRRRRARHGPRRRASRSSRPPPAAGSTRTTSTRRRSTRLARARHGGRRGRRLDGAGRAHPRRARLQRRRPQHDERRPPRLRMGARPRRQSAHERRAQRPQRLVGRRRAGPLRDRVQRATSRRCARPASSRSSPPATPARREHRREPCLGAGRGRGRQRDQPPTSSRRSRAAGRRRAATPSSRRSRPTATGSPSAGPAGETVVQGTSFAAPQVTGAVALLTAMYPGATPEAIIDALVRGARDVGAPGADTDTGAGILNVAQAAALLAGADHAGPRVNLSARWSKDRRPSRAWCSRVAPTSAAAGRATASRHPPSSRGTAYPPRRSRSRRRRSTRPSPTLTGTVTPRQVRRLIDGRHTLFARARDAAGNWGPVRADRDPRRPRSARACASAAHAGRRRRRRPARPRATARDSCSLRYRVEVAGHLGRWRWLDPAARAEVTLHAKRGRRAILRVRATDLVGNETKAGFVLPR